MTIKVEWHGTRFGENSTGGTFGGKVGGQICILTKKSLAIGLNIRCVDIINKQTWFDKYAI
jgi:hypothetical protein